MQKFINSELNILEPFIKKIGQLISVKYKKYFSNISWLLFEKMMRLFNGLVIGAIVARYLKPANYGMLNYIQSFVVLFVPIATFGLDNILIRELINNSNKSNEILGTSFILRLIGALLSILLLFFTSIIIKNDNNITFLLMITSISLFIQSFNIIDYFFQSIVLSKYIVISNVMSLLISSLLKILLVFWESSIIFFYLVLLLDTTIAIMGYIFFYYKNGFSLFSWKYDNLIAINLIKDSWPLMIGGIAASVYIRIDQIIIKSLINTEAVGYYAVSAKLTELWGNITIILTQTFMPVILRSKGKNNEEYLYRIQELYNILLKIAFWIAIIITIFAPEIILLLFGKTYSRSIFILRIYIWSILFVFLSNGSWSFFIANNLQKLASYRLIIGAVFNITLNIVLIPIYGLVGAALATIISYSISSYFFNLTSISTYKNFKMQTLAIVNIFNYKSYKSIKNYFK